MFVLQQVGTRETHGQFNANYTFEAMTSMPVSRRAKPGRSFIKGKRRVIMKRSTIAANLFFFFSFETLLWTTFNSHIFFILFI